MQKSISTILISTVLFIALSTVAKADIAPVIVKEDGVEPIEAPKVSIESADITVSPKGDGFNFDCTYVIKSLADDTNILLGIPGDPGYTLEVGYIENLDVHINGIHTEHKIYDTTKNLSEGRKNQNMSLNFKWHTFQVPIKASEPTIIKASYNTIWRIFDQNKTSPYYIIPFILSMDKLFFNNKGNYTIRYISDDIINIADVKVMMNSMLEPNIISQAILSPECNEKQIVWKFNNSKDFQDFRLIILPPKRLAMNFKSNTNLDPSIRWAMLNNDYEKLATLFEDVAKKNVPNDLSSEDIGTAAYLSAEFYYRVKNFDKALEMLSLPNQTALWPSNIKYEYISALKYDNENNYIMLLDELKKLQQYKDYILVSNFAEKRLEDISKVPPPKVESDSEGENEKDPDSFLVKLYDNRIYLSTLVILLVLAYLVYKAPTKR